MMRARYCEDDWEVFYIIDLNIASKFGLLQDVHVALSVKDPLKLRGTSRAHECMQFISKSRVPEALETGQYILVFRYN